MSFIPLIYIQSIPNDIGGLLNVVEIRKCLQVAYEYADLRSWLLLSSV